MGVDYWDAATWKQQEDEYEVFVMTPAIFLDALRHTFLKIDMIKVLIFDECHNARGKHPYACIMTEFYHRHLASKATQLPRIFGMTASPVKAKSSSSSSAYWKQIDELERLMNSKVYTCVDESVLAEYIPFSTPKLKTYVHLDVPQWLSHRIANDLQRLREKHEFSPNILSLSESAAESARKRLSKILSTLLFCLNELGVWLALKAAESLSCEESDIFFWDTLDISGKRVVKEFSLDAAKVFSASIPSGPQWSIGDDTKANIEAGYLTSKVTCLVDCLLEYRALKDLRCIIFVQRVITAIVLRSLLNELLPDQSGWKTEYTAGNNAGLQSQSRKVQNKIVEEFRKGMVNIIVATSILEEGLDVQSCNLVVRFDPSATVCSFIQSRGRARMQNSDFILMVESGDMSTMSRVKNYLASGDIMRQESLRHASLPCGALDSGLYDEACYQVETTGAVVNLSSSVKLLHFYCSRLPSDGYFKPSPRCVIDKELQTCTLHLPKSCPIPIIKVQGNIKILKELACLEACKQLHQTGALTDHLVPDIVEEKANAQEPGSEPYMDEQAKYFPPELVGHDINGSDTMYYCYLVELQDDFSCDIQFHDIMLAVRTKVEFDEETSSFYLDVDGDRLQVRITYIKPIRFTSEQVLLCRRFQVTILKLLRDHNFSKMNQVLGSVNLEKNNLIFDYLLFPLIGSCKSPSIDWNCVNSVLFPEDPWDKHDKVLFTARCGQVQTKSGLVCRCMLENSLVYTPHNGYIYCISGTLDDLDGNSFLKLRDGGLITYKEYYEKRHGIDLRFGTEQFLNGKHILTVQNCFQGCKTKKVKEPSKTSVELPPELCSIIMSPISISTVHSFSYVPSIMYRLESLLVATRLKKMHMDHCMQNVLIPTMKVLEAITTTMCGEKFDLESLETLGDSFLKYAACQQLFKTYQNHHEGLLSVKKDKMISNAALCKLGCERKIPGFIRIEPFDRKTWIIPGDTSGGHVLEEAFLSSTFKIYCGGSRKIKSKIVADVVEALIGAILSTGGETAALIFIDWLGIKVDFVKVPLTCYFPVNAEKLVNVKFFESLLNYSFRDPSLLVEALTHGSYMLPEVSRCYQRLEFLGDSVLDYLITMHLYSKYPGLSSGLLTDLRSASVNNNCYALSALKAGLHKHILHASQELQRHVTNLVHNLDQLSLDSTFGWESETTLPKVLGDIIESLAGAILVDSCYDKETVFQCIRPLLEPLVTPETLRLHPVRELNELCQRKGYSMKSVESCKNGEAHIIVDVEANGMIFNNSCSASDKKTAKRLACKNILKTIKEGVSQSGVH